MSEKLRGFWPRLLGGALELRLVVLLGFGLLVFAGVWVSPFESDVMSGRGDPVAVDAIPDLGDNQQIVFTDWPGRSPRDVEDQITYPLTTALLGVAKVHSVRSQSMFGFSTIYVIFEEDAEFYWSRSRLLEKLASLPPGLLPADARPTLGPDATALGQVFWYTLQGQDEQGKPVGGFSQEELRSAQDWTIRYALQSVEGVSEVASIGGYVREYQIDVNPEALAAHGVTLEQVAEAVMRSNQEVGARTLEINRAEYVVRSRGFLKEAAELEMAVVAVREQTPIRVSDVAQVGLGPAERRGALDDAGADAVGGVVVARFGANPRAVIRAVKERIAEISPGLPKKTLEDGTHSRMTIVPFYDRSQLIDETVGTLSSALLQQVLITVLVVLIMLRNLRASVLVSLTVPLAVYLAFLAMKIAGVGANIMSLAGIAIAIGTMVDLGIVLVESIVARFQRQGTHESRLHTIIHGAAEVAPSVLTSTATTVVSFLPVFAMEAAEGRLFQPLAYTKTFALVGALLLAVLLVPALATVFLVPFDESKARPRLAKRLWRWLRRPRQWQGYLAILAGAGAVAMLLVRLFVAVEPGPLQLLWCAAALFVLVGGSERLIVPRVPHAWRQRVVLAEHSIAILGVGLVLTSDWLPLGVSRGFLVNVVFVAAVVGLLLWGFTRFRRVYPQVLRWLLGHKKIFAVLPTSIVLFGALSWFGFERVFGFLPHAVRESSPGSAAAASFPGLGSEFMPSFDEGSFLYMPTASPHASLGQAREQLRHMDAAIATIPEVEKVVGKLGRVDSPLDPAPISMFETVITYRPEYSIDEDGDRVRNWRDHIRTPADIWNEIVRVAEQPGLTTASRLMPIETRLLMLQTGMRAPVGLKIFGEDLDAIEDAGRLIEPILRKVEGVAPQTVAMETVVGKPYLEIELDREAITRFGLTIADVQRTIQIAVGGIALTQTVEGRARYPVRVRYMREERNSVEALQRILVATPSGQNIPLSQIAHFRYARGPQEIRAEDTFKVGYLLFDIDRSSGEVDVARRAQQAIDDALRTGALVLPPGVSHVELAGSYRNQERSASRLRLLVPVSVVLVFILLYLQFRRVSTVLIIGSGVITTMAGGFVALWLCAQPWFFDLDVFGIDLRSIFHIESRNLSSAVWVGFIALIGIATDDGVVMGSYLTSELGGDKAESIPEIREKTIHAASRRILGCLMTTATTLLALLPVFTSSGRGADIMIPMAIPIFGGMIVELTTNLVVPVAYCWIEERKLASRERASTENPRASHQTDS